jgi:hypothetical protein
MAQLRTVLHIAVRCSASLQGRLVASRSGRLEINDTPGLRSPSNVSSLKCSFHCRSPFLVGQGLHRRSSP